MGLDARGAGGLGPHRGEDHAGGRGEARAGTRPLGERLPRAGSGEGGVLELRRLGVSPAPAVCPWASYCTSLGFGSSFVTLLPGLL